MEEYKMHRGETLGGRIPDMEMTVEDHFGPITSTEKFKGNDLHVVGGPKNPVFTRIVTGAVEYSDKKGKPAVNFEETDSADLALEDLEAAGEAVSAKNDLLLEATDRDVKSHRNSMKRAVEDDVPDV